MTDASYKTRKAAVGVLALVCLASAAVYWLTSDAASQSAFVAAVTRVGIGLAALWFALPEKGEGIVWERVLPIVIAAVVMIAFLRRAAAYVLPIGIGIALVAVLVRPRSRRRRGRDRSRE
jgi:hypothetical protein